MKLLKKIIVVSSIGLIYAAENIQPIKNDNIEPIKIGLTAPLTGGSASMGLGLVHGAKVAVDEINEKGGVLGRKIIFIEKDDEAKPEKSVINATELIQQEKIVANIGYCNTGLILASGHQFQEAKIPLVVPCAAGSAVTKLFEKEPQNYIFRVALNDGYQSKMIAYETVKKRGFKKVALMTDTTPYGTGGAKDNTAALKEYNIEPIIHEQFNVGDKDMTLQLERIKKINPDVIIVVGIATEMAVISQNMKKLKMTQPLIGTWPMSLTTFLDNCGTVGNYATMPQSFIQAPNTDHRKNFIEKYLNEFKPKNRRIESSVAAAQAYDAVYILAAAIEQAGSTDGVKIHESLENLEKPIDGLIKLYEKPYSKEDHEAISKDDSVMGMVYRGRVVYAYREDSKEVIQREQSRQAQK